jgi:hypothetical protein
MDREPVFGTRDGRTTRLRDPLPEIGAVSREIERKELTHLSHIATEVERALAPPATRLEALARLLVELPYGEFVEMSEGIKSARGQWDGSPDLASLIHAWAVGTLGGDRHAR